MLRFQGTIVPSRGFDLAGFLQTIRNKSTNNIGLKRGENRIAVYSPAGIIHGRIAADPKSSHGSKEDTFHFVYCESAKGQPVLETKPEMHEKILHWLKEGGFNVTVTDEDTNTKAWTKYPLWGAPQDVSHDFGTDQISPSSFAWDPPKMLTRQKAYAAAIIRPHDNFIDLYQIISKMLEEVKPKRTSSYNPFRSQANSQPA